MEQILKQQWRCDIGGGHDLLWIAIATHIIFLFFFYSFEVFCNLTSCLFCHFDPFILSSSWIGLDEFFSWLDVGVVVISKIGLNVGSFLNLVELSLVLLI